MSRGPAWSLDAGGPVQLGRRGVLFAVAALGIAGAATGCTSVHQRADDSVSVAVDTTAPRVPVDTTAPRVAAGTFPSVRRYSWAPVPDEEWAVMWTAVRNSYHGFVADGQARYVRGERGDPVGVVVVAWPSHGKGDAAEMKAAMDQQAEQAAQHYGMTSRGDIYGHQVLEFTDLDKQPNWYWVSGDEFVMVTAHEYDSGAAFVANLSARTR